MKTIKTTTALTLALVALAACGENKTDRAISGGALGAAGGAVLGSTVGHGGAGALLGGAAGAAIGAGTDSNDVDLGKPVWR